MSVIGQGLGTVRDMTDGERLLDLAAEYHEAKDSRSAEYDGIGEPVGREPAEIAAEYVETLRAVLQR